MADYTLDEVTAGLMAMVMHMENAAHASRDLAAREPPTHIPPATLKSWVRTTHFEHYQRLRDEYAPQIEAQLAHRFRDVAALAVAVQVEALEQAHAALARGEDKEPARTASFAARAAQSAVDKLMTLTSRPQRIVETRDVNAVLRSLSAKGVLVGLPEGPLPVDGDAEDEGE